MRRTLVGAALAGVVTLGSSQMPPTNVASIAVSVTTDTGSTVGGLTAGDFDVRVDGQPAAIQRVTAPPVPITLVVLFDITSSMTMYGGIEEEIARSVVPSLRAGDRARVGAIANRLSLAPVFSSAPREILAAGRKAMSVRREDRYGPSPIWDALKTSADALASESGRRAILIVTDGRATGNAVSAADAVDAAVAAEAVVEVLSENRTSFYRQGAEQSYVRVRTGYVLEELARLTGGLILPSDPKPTADLPPASEAIPRLINDVREMYSIEIAQPGPAGSAHRVEVRVKRGGLAVRARSALRVP